MDKIIIIIIIIIFPFVSNGQENKHKLSWRSNLIFETNSLDKDILNSMIYNNHITNDMKSRWINSSSKYNIISSEISNILSYSYNYSNTSVGFSLADINLLNASFTDDLLRLGLEGNFHYQNETLDLSGTNIRANRFQKYKITYSRDIKNMNINGGVSYLLGNHHLSYIMENGSLYTAPFGTYLEIEYDIDVFVTDTSDLSPLRHNGNGVAVDFGTNFSIKEIDIEFSLKDLGYIIWNKSSINLITDTAFNFQGSEVEDIFNFNDSVIQENNLIDNIIRTNNASFKSYIPATICLSILGKTKHKYLKTYNAGIIAKWQPYRDNRRLSFSKINQGFKESNFSPLYYIHSIFKAKYYNLIPSLRYGGYSRDTNIGLALSKGTKRQIIIGTQHLEDIFNGNEAKALSLYINIQLQF